MRRRSLLRRLGSHPADAVGGLLAGLTGAQCQPEGIAVVRWTDDDRERAALYAGDDGRDTRAYVACDQADLVDLARRT